MCVEGYWRKKRENEREFKESGNYASKICPFQNYTSTPRNFAIWGMSLSPLPDRLMTMFLPFPSFFASFSTAR